MLLIFYRPHQPYTPLPYWRKLFDASSWGAGRNHQSSIAKPSSYDRDISGLPPALQHYHNANGEPWCIAASHENDGQGMRDYLNAYYALVAEMDHRIGSIIKALKANNCLENTIIIYTTDHGDFVGEHGLVEKAAWGHNVYEATLRVPLIIQTPDMKNPGRVSNDLVELVDIVPSILDLCDIKPEQAGPLSAAGTSLAAHLQEQQDVERRYAFSQNYLQRTIVSQGYKLSLPTDQAEGYVPMLFERSSDPHELLNRYQDPALATIRDELSHALQQHEEQIPIYN